jgi:3-phenylpropionate/trans-cinnamate dioxygenase ferredoxin reductase subunit
MSPLAIVIAGGGLAAQRAAESLRRSGHDGTLRMVCAEPHLPYDRPPLSKELLAGELDPGALALRPSEWYRDHDVDRLSGTAATSLDVRDRRLGLSDGTSLTYDRLLLATGAAARSLPALEAYGNVHTLRTLEDALALAAALRPGARMAVLGAGFVGLEVAATARGLGAKVTVLEALATPVARVLPPVLGHWLASLHRSHGAEVILGSPVVAFQGTGERLEALELGDGRRVECDSLVVGIGAAPETAWLADTPLAGSCVAADGHGRTGVTGVFAAGDVAGGDHWEAAAHQGKAVGRAMLGLTPSPAPPPGFWSDQYGVRIQVVGDVRRTDTVCLDGEPATNDFTAAFFREGRLAGALLTGRPHRLPALRRALAATPQSTADQRSAA